MRRSSEGLSDGPYTLVVRGADTAGNVGAELTWSFVVDTGVPLAPTGLSPSGGVSTSTTPTVTGTAEPGATVAVRVDNIVSVMVTADDAGAFSFTVGAGQALSPGGRTLTATDAAGNRTSPATGIRVDVAVPVALGGRGCAAAGAGAQGPWWLTTALGVVVVDPSPAAVSRASALSGRAPTSCPRVGRSPWR